MSGIADSTNAKLAFNYLTVTCGYNCAAACGILANLWHESGILPNNLQNSYESKLGYTDASYTKAVDNGTYTNFVKDSAGYGICQWTYWSRKQGLLNYAKSKGVSIADLTMQLDYLIKELTSGSYKTAINSIKGCSNDAAGAYRVGHDFCYNFERPANTSTVSVTRGEFAKNTVYPLFAGTSSTPASKVTGSDIVATAKSLIGKPYNINNNNPTNFSSQGFVHYCYAQHGVSIPTTSEKQAVCGSAVNPGELIAGDIAFFGGSYSSNKNTPSYAAIATGDGYNVIGCMGSSGYATAKQFDYTTSDTWSSRYLGAIRLIEVDTTNTSSATGGLIKDSYVSTSPSTVPVTSVTTSLSSGDSYSSNMTSALNHTDSNYSSIINLRTGDEFKFYLNESVSENNPVSYSSPGNILGRTVPVLGYDSTGAKTVTLNLRLFAGTPYRPGLTSTTADPVGVLHSDIALLKSFLYPDYSTAIVIPPAPVLMSVEGTLKIRGVLQSVSVNYSRPLDEKGRAMVADLSITVTQVSEDPPDYSDIKNQTSKSY